MDLLVEFGGFKVGLVVGCWLHWFSLSGGENSRGCIKQLCAPMTPSWLHWWADARSGRAGRAWPEITFV